MKAEGPENFPMLQGTPDSFRDELAKFFNTARQNIFAEYCKNDEGISKLSDLTVRYHHGMRAARSNIADQLEN